MKDKFYYLFPEINWWISHFFCNQLKNFAISFSLLAAEFPNNLKTSTEEFLDFFSTIEWRISRIFLTYRITRFEIFSQTDWLILWHFISTDWRILRFFCDQLAKLGGILRICTAANLRISLVLPLSVSNFQIFHHELLGKFASFFMQSMDELSDIFRNQLAKFS